MSFVPKRPVQPTRVEDLFVLDGQDKFAYMVATLSNGTQLFLSDGPSSNYPSPWPLYYEPYVIEHAPAVEWLDKCRAMVLKHRPDLQDIYLYKLPRGIGRFVAIDGLELWKCPSLDCVVYNGSTYGSKELYRDSFTFDNAPITSFTPVSSREEAIAHSAQRT